MIIEVSEPEPPFDKPPFACRAAVEVGGIRYEVGPTSHSDLRENALAFVRGLQERRPFAPEFGYEPLFNVRFDGKQFVTFLHQRRFKRHFPWWIGPRWLLGKKAVSRPEDVAKATAYLTRFAANLIQS